MSLITQQQLESYLWGAAVLLRGTIDAGDYKQFIFPLLFLKRLCDVYDEETAGALAESGGDEAYAAFPEHHRFQIPAGAHWRDVRQVTRDVGAALQGAMRAIETANPDKLYGIFGDAPWTNKDRLTDAMLRDLVEHFSTLELTIANLPEDALGQGYEYLIKRFADDSGHTAAEFYTNRTVVHLMTELLQPQPGEAIYDPTCGSGGMLLSAIAHLQRQGQEWRNVWLYGQERNLMTSSIARMNCFLHGIEDFQIVRGDTLSRPAFLEGDRLMQFDVVLANPPYSVKQWDRATFSADPWGRNLYGTPPQGRADYAFWQHVLCSLAPGTGRCAILFPHGVLFRQEEAEMRRRLLEADLVEAIIGLGPNLFYNSPMEACVVVCRARKPAERRGRILFIHAVNEVIRERAQSYLTEEHIARIAGAYERYTDEPGFCCVAPFERVRAQGGNLSIPLYVSTNGRMEGTRVDPRAALAEALDDWLASRAEVAEALRAVLPDLPVPDLDLSLGRIEACGLFDRRGWQRVRFGDVVQNVSETEREPFSAGIERFIGLEHLEPGSLTLPRGDVADGTSFTRRCRPGQVLFGKRRAYQRKVAVAEFDAVVSGDIYVFAPKGDRLLADLLPFICLTERFYQHAVETSAGSLSPRTNWTHLAKYEFDLPPLDQQRRIAELLWAADKAVSQQETAMHAMLRLRGATVSEFVADYRSEAAVLGDHLVLVQYGCSAKAAPHGSPGLLPVLRIPNVVSGRLDLSDLVWLEPVAEYARYSLQTGDVLVVRTNGNPEYVGQSAVYTGSEYEHCLFASYLIRLRTCCGMLLPEYLREVLASDDIRSQLRGRIRSSAGNYNLNAAGLRELRIPLPSISAQHGLLSELSQIDTAVRSAGEWCASVRRISMELRECTISSALGDAVMSSDGTSR